MAGYKLGLTSLQASSWSEQNIANASNVGGLGQRQERKSALYSMYENIPAHAHAGRCTIRLQRMGHSNRQQFYIHTSASTQTVDQTKTIRQSFIVLALKAAGKCTDHGQINTQLHVRTTRWLTIKRKHAELYVYILSTTQPSAVHGATVQTVSITVHLWLLPTDRGPWRAATALVQLVLDFSISS